MNRTSRRPPFTALVLVLTAVLGHVLLWTGQPLGGFVLPVAAVGALLLRRPDPPAAGGWLVFGVAAAGALAIGYGALATPERSWDGFATWSLTARHLNDGAGLDAPYFANHSVYQAVRGYPLLQPILLQQCSHWLGTAGGRALFPALWLLLLLVVAGELRAAGVAANLRSLAVVGTALVPLFTEPGHGSAESGFADLLLAIVLTWGVGAVVRRDAPLAAAVALLLPVCKHEGGVHLALLLAVAMLAGRGRVALVMAGAGTLTLLAWLPLQAALTFVPAERRAGTVAFAAVPLVVAAATAALRWRPSRWPAVVAFAVALVAAPWWLGGGTTELPRTTAAVLGGGVAPAALVPIGASLVVHLVWLRKLGLTFVVLVAAAALACQRRNQPGAAWWALAQGFAWLGGWLVVVVLFLATLPPDRLSLYLAEGLVRYLAQATGAAWLLVGLCLHELRLGAPAAPATARAAEVIA
jgi:hypothetical protein